MDTLRECHANKAVEAGIHTSYVHSSICKSGDAVTVRLHYLIILSSLLAVRSYNSRPVGQALKEQNNRITCEQWHCSLSVFDYITLYIFDLNVIDIAQRYSVSSFAKAPLRSPTEKIYRPYFHPNQRTGFVHRHQHWTSGTDAHNTQEREREGESEKVRYTDRQTDRPTDIDIGP